MHIFIDESGSFVSSDTGSGVSLVGALVIPNFRLAQVEKKFAAMRVGFPTERGEVKGRMLTEAQVARVVEMLRKNDALLHVVMIDLNYHTLEDIEAAKQDAIDGCTSRLTPEHHPRVVQEANDLAQRFRVLSNQLYVQGALMTVLAEQTIELAVNYFGQRQPCELAEFHWLIDAKAKTGPTNWELLWRTMVWPLIQFRSSVRPMSMFVGVDQTHFKRFDATVPPYIPRPTVPHQHGHDIKLIMTEHFRSSSGIESGLELADIVTSATRRALVGNLRHEGWAQLPSLMIHNPQQQSIHITVLNNRHQPDRLDYGSVLECFKTGGRSMLAPRFLKPGGMPVDPGWAIRRGL